MGKDSKACVERVARHFDYLPAFGFAVVSIEESSIGELRVTYKSRRAAVAVVVSNEYTRAEVQLMRLVDGELPEYPSLLVDSLLLHTFYLDDLLLLRIPDVREAVQLQHGPCNAEIDAQLAFWSTSLRRHGEDFLRGDLRVLDEMERLVRERAGQSAPERVVSIPVDTPGQADDSRWVPGVATEAPSVPGGASCWALP
jgi:hypothetical protein